MDIDAYTYGGHWNGSESNITWAHTVGSSNGVLIVFITVTSGKTVSGCTYNGVAMTQISDTGGSSYRIYCFKMINPPTGSHNVSASCNGVYMRGSAVSFSGADQTTQPDVTPVTGWNNSSGWSSPKTISITTENPSWLVAGIAAVDGGVAASTDTQVLTNDGAELNTLASATSRASGSNNLVYTFNGRGSGSYNLVAVRGGQTDVTVTPSVLSVTSATLAPTVLIITTVTPSPVTGTFAILEPYILVAWKNTQKPPSTWINRSKT